MLKVLWIIIIVITSSTPVDELVSVSKTVCNQMAGDTYLDDLEFNVMLDKNGQFFRVVAVRCLKNDSKEEKDKLIPDGPYHEL